jgi:hypothetical protein
MWNIQVNNIKIVVTKVRNFWVIHDKFNTDSVLKFSSKRA